MAASTFDLFETSIGLSGSHTAEPMRAARLFALALRDDGLLDRTVCVKCELHGSLAPAGHRHGSDKAVLLGLEGEEADRLDPAAIAPRLRHIHDKRELRLLGTRRIAYDKRHHLVFPRRETLPSDPDGMRLSAFDPAGWLLLEKTYLWNVGLDEDPGQPRLVDGQRSGPAGQPAALPLR
jgi:L-serine dehydratase